MYVPSMYDWYEYLGLQLFADTLHACFYGRSRGHAGEPYLNQYDVSQKYFFKNLLQNNLLLYRLGIIHLYFFSQAII